MHKDNNKFNIFIHESREIEKLPLNNYKLHILDVGMTIFRGYLL